MYILQQNTLPVLKESSTEGKVPPPLPPFHVFVPSLIQTDSVLLSSPYFL